MASESAYCFNDMRTRMLAKCSNISSLARLTSLHSLDRSGCDQIGDLSLLSGRTRQRRSAFSSGAVEKPLHPLPRSLRNKTGCPIANRENYVDPTTPGNNHGSVVFVYRQLKQFYRFCMWPAVGNRGSSALTDGPSRDFLLSGTHRAA
jgi:hypothetical protein